MSNFNGRVVCLTVAVFWAMGLAGCSRGTPANFVADPDFRLGTTYWSASSANIRIVNAKGNQAGIVLYNGRGEASGYQYVVSEPIILQPGHFYTISGYIDAAHAISGRPSWAVFDGALKTQLASAELEAGFAARVSTGFKLPDGVSSVRVLCDTNNAVVANGKTLSCAAPSLTLATFGSSSN